VDPQNEKRDEELAEQLEDSLELVKKNEIATVALMERLQKQAADLRIHAEHWERVNPSRAARVLEEEQDVLELVAKLARIADMSADEVTAIMAEADKALERAARRPHADS
jgi:hypothetical protein